MSNQWVFIESSEWEGEMTEPIRHVTVCPDDGSMPTHSNRIPRARVSRRIFSACSLFEASVRAFCGISARSHRAGSSIQPFGAQHGEYRHLAVVDLAQPPRPLPDHTHRTITLLGKAAFVDPTANC
jgi:hypothetical protein